MEEIQKDSSGICQHLSAFSDVYKGIHSYLSLTMCCFGIIFNVSNFVVFCQKEMIRSPINRILLSITVADLLLLVEYIPFCMHEYLWADINDAERYSWNWAAFVWFHANFSILIHTINICLTLCLAVWRFIMIKLYAQASTYCTIFCCQCLICLAYIVPVFLTIPNMLALAIKPRLRERNCGLTKGIKTMGKRLEL